MSLLGTFRKRAAVTRPSEAFTEELALAWPGFVGAAAVDGRNLRTHRAQIHGELAAMVNAVVVDEAEVEHHPGS